MTNNPAEVRPNPAGERLLPPLVLRIGIVMTGVVLLDAAPSFASVYVSPSVGTSLEMKGDYILTGISSNGTLGVGGNTSPGFLFDPDGTASFGGRPDYLTPGIPAEGFSITYSGSGGVLSNDNSGNTCTIGTAAVPTDVSGGSASDNAVLWSGTIAGVLTVEHLYEFDDSQKNVGITTTITALADLTDLTFARWIDPDSGGAMSQNNRGNASIGFAPKDWVNSVSDVNGATLGLYSESSTTHNTGFTFPWSRAPADYIAGGFNGDGSTTEHTFDDMIGIGFNIGDLNNGQSIALEYAYVVSADQDDVDVGVGKWIGNADGNWDNDANWNPQRAPSDGDNVTIESSGNPTLNHNVTGNIYGDWTFNAASAQVAIQGNDVTAADGKTLRNNSSHLQTFSVDVITVGNLTIDGGANGLSLQNLQIANGSTVTFDTGSADGNVVNGAVSGAASVLAATGSGTLELAGANTYSGGTSITGATLRVGADNRLGDAGGGLSFNGGSLQFSSGFTSARSVTLNGSGGTIDTNGNDAELSGNLAGTGSLEKTGAGRLTLSGANTYSGGTTVSAGTLQGNTTGLQGDIVNNAAVVFDQDADGTYTGLMSGIGSLTKTGDGTLTLSADSTYSGATGVDGGALILNGTSVSNFAINSGARFGGNGTVASLDNGGTVAPGNSIGTITVTGDYVHDSSATYEVEVNDSGQSDLIDVTGTATINGGTVDVQPEPGTYTPGTRYTILEADGGVTGTFDTLTGSVTGARLQLFYNPTSIDLFLAPLYLATARTPNQKAVAAVLEQMALSPTGDVGTVLGQLDSVLDTPGAETYFDQLGGELFGTAASVGLQNTSLFLETIGRRLRTMDGFEAAGGSGSAPAYVSPPSDGLDDTVVRGQSASWLAGAGSCWRPWVQGYGVSASARGDGNASGFDYGIGGTTVAIDRALDDCTRFGLVGGYSNSQIRLDGPAQRAFVDSGQFALYLQRYGCRRYLTGVFSYAHNGYDTSRRLAFGDLARMASADYHGNEVSFYLEGGRTFRWGSLQLQPYGALQYIGLHQSAFSETGAGAMNLTVDGEQTDSFRGLLGSRLVWYDRSVAGRVLAPELRAFWRHEFLDEDRLVGASFAGAPGGSFVVAGADLGRDVALLGGGYSVYFGDRLSMFANYDVLVNNTEVAHVGTGGLQFLW